MEDPEEELEEAKAPPEDEVVDVEHVHSSEGETVGLLALLKKRSKEIFGSFSAASGSFAVGTIIGWTSPVLPKLNYTDEEESWIGSTMTIGAALATFHSAYLLDNLGSRATMILQIFPYVIGWIILVFGHVHVSMMYLGRFLLGVANGATSMGPPVYIAEISSPDVRGALATLFQFMQTFGTLYVYLLGKFLSYTLLCFACLLWPIIHVGTIILLPESPYFLAKQHKMDAATKSVLYFRPDGDPEEEFEEMQEALNIKPEPFFRVMRSKPARKATIVVLMLMFFQQVSGINTFMFNSEHLFELSESSLSGEDATIVLGALQCFITGVTAGVVDSMGRRFLLLTSYIGMCLCHILVAVYFHTFYLDKKANWLPMMCIFVYIIFFSLGAGPMPWTLLGEVLPPAAKGSVSCSAVFLSWTMAFIVTKSFYTIKNALHIAAPFWLYGMFSALGTLLIFVVVPETKGKTLKQIQIELGN